MENKAAETDILASLRGRLIVSCQTRAPLNTSDYIADLAAVMVESGAGAVRVNSPEHIAAVRRRVKIPIVGIHKQRSEDYRIYITPTRAAARAVIDAGADIVALDGADAPRPDGSTLETLIAHVHNAGALVMADVSTYSEGRRAAEAGADIVATTLSGYTSYSPQQAAPDLQLVEALARDLAVPVVAEGRYNTPELVRAAFGRGAFAVVVGRAITEPRFIVQPFLEAGVAG